MQYLLTFITNHHIQGILSIVFAVIYVLLAICATVHILLHKSDIRSSIGWIALVFLSPFVGSIAYLFLGINRVSRKAVKLRSKGIITKYASLEMEEIYDALPEVSKQFLVYGQHLYPQDVTLGNSIKPLLNGVEAYPQMIEAIRNAKKEVLVESYIFDCDEVTEDFFKAFEIAISNGAQVKVLVDGIGTLKLFRRTIEKRFKKIKGLKFGVFLPPKISIALPFVNLRNHRKIMIIDGVIAFFGGMNLSKDNVLIDDIEKGILDITFKVEGAVIDQISQVFEDDWEFVTGEIFQAHSNFLPETEVEVGNIAARIIPDGPDNPEQRIKLILQEAINVATKDILIVTPYFLPENDILTALEMAAMRGVNIEIILPEISDHIITNWAQEPNFLRLLLKGIKIYKTPPPFDHSKIFVVDGKLSFIGSANWDVRSFRLHFETNMEVMGREFAGELIKIVNAKKAKAKPVTIVECKSLPLLKRIRNNAFRLITPYY